MGSVEVEGFLNHLAVNRQVSASTQSVALNAIVFLYGSVLQQPIGEMTSLKRVQRMKRVPVVLTVDEVRIILGQMTGTTRLMAELSTGPACGCWSACRYVLRISTSGVARSRCATARARRIVRRCFRTACQQRFKHICSGWQPDMPVTYDSVRVLRRCLVDWRESIRMPLCPGPGNSCFRRPYNVHTGILGNCCAGTHRRLRCNERSKEPSNPLRCISMRACIRSVIHSRHISSQTAPTSALSNCCSVTAAFRQR